MSIRLPIICLTLVSLFSCKTGAAEEGESFDLHAAYIQIVLFHLEQRCASCNAVEEETMRLLEGEYNEAFQSGKIKFIPMNYQSEHGRKAAELLRAAGQTLYVVYGDSISNLTSAAFFYAQTHPDYYHKALRKELDKYLK